MLVSFTVDADDAPAVRAFIRSRRYVPPPPPPVAVGWYCGPDRQRWEIAFARYIKRRKRRRFRRGVIRSAWRTFFDILAGRI